MNNNDVVDDLGFSDIGDGGNDSEAILRLTKENSILKGDARIKEEEARIAKLLLAIRRFKEEISF